MEDFRLISVSMFAHTDVYVPLLLRLVGIVLVVGAVVVIMTILMWQYLKEGAAKRLIQLDQTIYL